jgi:hypothetical protein
MNSELVILLTSSGFLIAGTILWQKGNHLLKNVKTADAIIFKNNFQSSRSAGLYYPVVRFLTEKQEWITQELSIGYLTAKEEGTKLRVIYDPEEPTNVEINSTLQLELLPRLFVVLGIVGLKFGTLEYLDVIEFIAS